MIRFSRKPSGENKALETSKERGSIGILMQSLSATNETLIHLSQDGNLMKTEVRNDHEYTTLASNH